LQLTLVDAATRKKFVFEEKFYHLTFEETLQRALDKQLREVVKNRAS
jgi:hypothetical protein